MSGLPENLGYKPHLKKMSNLVTEVGKAFKTQNRSPKAIDTSQFNGVTNTINNYKPRNTNVDNVMKAIGQYESGGNYNAMGPRTAKGNQAYGKYQVMDFNIPNWTREALGKSLTPQQFLGDKIAQDKVAQYKMSRLLKQYGNPEDVASVWFSGRPVSKAGNAKDVIGTSVPQYIKNVTALMGKDRQKMNPVSYVISKDKDGNEYRYSHLLQRYVRLDQQQELNPYLNYQIRELKNNLQQYYGN